MRVLSVDRSFLEDPESFARSGAEALEISLDTFPGVLPGKLRLLADRAGLPVLATFGGGWKGKVGLLERTILARFDYVEMELEMDVETRGRILALARKHGTKVVLSHRAGRPPQTIEATLRLFQKCSRAGGDLARAHFPVRRARDVRLLRDAHKALTLSGVAHSMTASGPLGPLVSLFGGELAFGRLPGSKGDGQDLRILSRMGRHTRLFAILGEPPHPSLSIELLNGAFGELGQDCVCLALQPGEDDLGDTLRLLDEMGFEGLLVGRPFRERILWHVACPEACAGSAGAVMRRPGGFAARDTEGPALLAALESAGIRVPRRKAVVLGSGGAARSAAHALSSRGVQVLMVGRNLRRTLSAASVSGTRAAPIDSLPSLLLRSSLLVSCIPEGAEKLVPESALRRELAVVDLACTPRRSPLLHTALEAGCLTVPGTSVLLHGSAEALRLFTGRRPPMELLVRILERNLR